MSSNVVLQVAKLLQSPPTKAVFASRVVVPTHRANLRLISMIHHCILCLFELTEPVYDMPFHRILETSKEREDIILDNDDKDALKWSKQKRSPWPQTTGCGFHSSSSGSTAPRSHVPGQNKERRDCMGLHLSGLKTLSVCRAYVYIHMHMHTVIQTDK